MTTPYGSTVPERTAVWIVRNFSIIGVTAIIAGLILLGAFGIKSCSNSKRELYDTHEIIKVWPGTSEKPQQEQMRKLYAEGWKLHKWTRNGTVAVMVRKRE